MSTNFYLVPNGAPRNYQEFHIGKRSNGWVFLWRGYTTISLCTPVDWIAHINQMTKHADALIVDERGMEYTAKQFLDMVRELSVGKYQSEDQNVNNLDGIVPRPTKHDGSEVLFAEFC